MMPAPPLCLQRSRSLSSPIASSRNASPCHSATQPTPDQDIHAGSSGRLILNLSGNSCEDVTEVTENQSLKTVAAKPDRSPATTSPPSKMRSRRTTTTRTLGEHHFPVMSAIVKSKQFEVCIGVVIIINCITMGLEAELMLGKAQEAELYVHVSEHIATCIFVVELLLRILVYGWKNFAPLPGTLWNFLDAILVLVTGVLVVWILPLLGLPDATDSLQTLTVLRALRLARLVRVVQRFEAFHEVWLLLRGLMESGRVLFWTVVVIFFITYLFAVFGVVLLGVPIKEEYENAVDTSEGASSELEELVEVTGGVTPLMYTLIQVLTLDSWNSIARPMQKYIAWAWAYFYLYIAIAVIVMMNLVTAVIVENALKNSQKDANAILKEKDQQKQVQLARFRRVFEEMDLNGDGELSWPEFESAFDDKDLSAQLRLLGIEPEHCREIFNMLDSGDGVLSVQEFFEGIMCMEGMANSKDLLRTNRTADLLVKLLCQQSQELREDLDELLRYTPGASVRARKGSLRSRARRQQSNLDVFYTNGTSDTDTIASSPSMVGRRGHSFRNEEQATLNDVMKGLHQLTAMLHESRQESQQSYATCNQRVLTLTSYVCDKEFNLPKGAAFPEQWSLPPVVLPPV